MNATVYVLFALLLGGCASFDAAQNDVAQTGAKAADEARQTAEWTLCNGISVGAWRRAYAGDEARAQGWSALCAQPNGLPK